MIDRCNTEKKSNIFRMPDRVNPLLEFAQPAMPLIKSGISLQSDMRLGWKPITDVTGAPIPLYYDYEIFDLPVKTLTGDPYEVLYLGPRYKHSIAMHKAFANRLLPDNK